MKIIKSGIAMLAICTFCLLSGCSSSVQEDIQEFEVSETTTLSGPKCLCGKSSARTVPKKETDKKD